MSKILYVTTIAGTMNFFSELFKSLLVDGHKIELACNCDRLTNKEIESLGLKVHNIPFSRAPYSKSNLTAYNKLKKVIKAENFDLVHCHTPNAAAITRLACRKLRKNGLNVLYTAHGFHFYGGAPLKNWLLYYPVEWLCSFWTDTLITINMEDYERARKRMHAKKIIYIPGVGIDLNKFYFTKVDRNKKRAEIGIPDDAILLISVGELNKNKNQETVIRAISDLNVFYVIVGSGDRKERLENTAAEVGMSNRVKLLGYRSDVNELYRISDVFVFPSFREGLSVSLIEAMASGLPCVVSRIRGNSDLIDATGGELFDPKSVNNCRLAIKNVLENNIIELGSHNKMIAQQYAVKKINEQMKGIYESVCGYQKK